MHPFLPWTASSSFSFGLWISFVDKMLLQDQSQFLVLKWQMKIRKVQAWKSYITGLELTSGQDFGKKSSRCTSCPVGKIWASVDENSPLKVEKILKRSLNSIPLPWHSMKIQIMGGKVCLMCKGKTFLGVVNKLLKIKKFVDNAQQCFAFTPQANFNDHILNFH